MRFLASMLRSQRRKHGWKVAFVTHRLAVTLCLVDNMRKQGAEWSMFGTPSQLGTVFKGAISQIA